MPLVLKTQDSLFINRLQFKDKRNQILQWLKLIQQSWVTQVIKLMYQQNRFGKDKPYCSLFRSQLILLQCFQIDESPFVHNYLPTLGMNLYKKVIDYKQQKLNVCIWDTAGQEKFFSLTKTYFQQADGVILVYDTCDQDSFTRLEEFWLQQVLDSVKQNAQVILIGNKIDLQENRKVKYIQAQELALRLKIKYFETSAKTGEQVLESIDYLAKNCADKIETEINENIQLEPPQKKNIFDNCFGSIKSLFKKN
ncbi:hypothetical protein pb186bvf_012945 [Paramecium bursaria]